MSLLHDLRYAFRVLRQAPLFSAGAIAILALGIGATTAMFSLIDAALIRPLPFPDARRLVMVYARVPQNARNSVAGLDFVDFSEQNRSFAVMAATLGAGAPIAFAATETEIADTVTVSRVTAGYFEALAIHPIAGRTFTADDTPVGADLRPGVFSEVAIISDRFWRNRLGGDPAILGRTIRLGSPPQTRRIVGVVPADAQVLGNADIWAPTPDLRMTDRRLRFLRVIARLRPDVTIDQAQADLNGIADRIAGEAPETNRGVGAAIVPLHTAIVGEELRATSLVLGGIVTFVLLLACANVANLILARGVGRTREIAVRAAIGGSRARIVRQLVTESLVLGVLGGGAGLLLSSIILRVAPALIPARTIPEPLVLGFDWRLAAFAVVLTLVTALLVGLIPAWQAVRVPLVESLAAGGRGTTDGAGRIRTVLAAIEVAAALLLLIGAGLFGRTLMAMNRDDPGYRADSVVTMAIGRTGMAQEVLAPWFAAIEREVAAVPGVRVVGFTSDLPLDGQTGTQPFTVVGDPPIDQTQRTNAHYQIITPRYFEALGMTPLQGRAFTDQDTIASTPVCIINEELARRYFSGRRAIGARISVPSITAKVPVDREIVGVVRRIAIRPGEVERPLEIYVPVAQNAWGNAMLTVRTAGDPAALVPSIKAAIARVDRSQTVSRVRTMEQVAAEATARPRFRAQLVGAFAAVAVTLAAIGIFSVVMFSVQQRRREFGIRLALGGSPRDVVTLVLRFGLRLTALGLGTGLIAAGILVRSLSSLLFGVAPLDPVAFAGALAIVATMAILSCVVPALHAVRSNPAATLRSE